MRIPNTRNPLNNSIKKQFWFNAETNFYFVQKTDFIQCRKEFLYSAKNCFFFFFNIKTDFCFEISGSPKKDCYFKKSFEKDFEEKHLKNTFLKKLWKKKYIVLFSRVLAFLLKKISFLNSLFFVRRGRNVKKRFCFKNFQKTFF